MIVEHKNYLGIVLVEYVMTLTLRMIVRENAGRGYRHNRHPQPFGQC